MKNNQNTSIIIKIKLKSKENRFKQFVELATPLIYAIADVMHLPKALFKDFFSHPQSKKR